MEYPKFLYHYTTIETLALILKYKSIRFNKLTNTDDLEESMTSDLNNLGRFLFVSCWTDSADESIPLWHIYSKRLSGVRIKLPFIPFKDYMPEYFNNPLIEKKGVEKIEDIKMKLYLPIEYTHNDSFMCHAFFNEPSETENMYKVQYTDDPELLLPKVFFQDKEGYNINFGNVGKYKRSCWDFQKEWRYRIQAIPLSTQKVQDPSIGMAEIQNCMNKIQGDYNIPLEYIDLVIDDKAFEQMEIVKGPGISESQGMFIDLVVQRYNPAALVKESNLKGKINSR